MEPVNEFVKPSYSQYDENIDKLCIPILDAFNNLLEMPTELSCCGHYTKNGYIAFKPIDSGLSNSI